MLVCVRVLGFHRVPPTTGRLINVTHDVKRMADSKLLKTFFVSPGKSSRTQERGFEVALPMFAATLMLPYMDKRMRLYPKIGACAYKSAFCILTRSL
jgi:hypothetical protein